jgi:hypothetical protein
LPSAATADGVSGGGMMPSAAAAGGVSGGGVLPPAAAAGGVSGGGMMPSAATTGGVSGGGMMPSAATTGGVSGGGTMPSAATTHGVSGGGMMPSTAAAGGVNGATATGGEAEGGGLPPAATAAGGVGRGGTLRRWEEMDWGELEGQYGLESRRVPGGSSKRRELAATLCMWRPADFRLGGLVTTEWEKMFEEYGVAAHLVEKVMLAVRWVVEQLWHRTWEQRNALVHGAGQSSAAEEHKRRLLQHGEDMRREMGVEGRVEVTVEDSYKVVRRWVRQVSSQLSRFRRDGREQHRLHVMWGQDAPRKRVSSRCKNIGRFHSRGSGAVKKVNQALLVEIVGWSRRLPPAAPADYDYPDAEVFNAERRGVTEKGPAVSKRGDSEASAEAFGVTGRPSRSKEQIRKHLHEQGVVEHALEKLRERGKQVDVTFNDPGPKPEKRDTG